MLRRLLAAVALGVALVAVWLAPAASAAPPNIVFVLTDDLAWNLVQYMPHVQDLQNRGMTFSRYFVTDSLCCPSRSSIFSGRYPHNTKIFTNKSPDGGFDEFHARGEEGSTWATDLQGAGYRTAMMGKYLNGYMPGNAVDGRRLYIPPGWNEWDVAGNGYGEFNYNLNQDGQLVHHGLQPQDYLTDVVGGRAVSFINGAADAGQPFALEVATFAPHAPYTPAPRNAQDFPGLGAPRGPAFDYQNTGAPRWLSGHAPLSPQQINQIDTSFRKRAQSVEAVDDMIGEHRGHAAGARPGRQHLHRLQLRQRLPHGRAPAAAREDDRVRHRHPRAAGRGRPRRARRPDDDADRRERRPAPDLRRHRRRGGPARASTGTACCRCSTAPRRAAGGPAR